MPADKHSSTLVVGTDTKSSQREASAGEAHIGGRGAGLLEETREQRRTKALHQSTGCTATPGRLPRYDSARLCICMVRQWEFVEPVSHVARLVALHRMLIGLAALVLDAYQSSHHATMSQHQAVYVMLLIPSLGPWFVRGGCMAGDKQTSRISCCGLPTSSPVGAV